MALFRKSRIGLGLDTNRVEAFSDGVFAVAITILIFGLTVPVLNSVELQSGALSAAIWALWPKILSYAISFAVIGIFWVGHHIMFHFIKRVDRNLIWLNILFLMIIAFFPFPVSVIGEYTRQEVSIMLYGVTLTLAGLAFGAMWRYASYKRRLISASLPDRIVNLGGKVVLMAPLVYVAAMLLYFISPTITLTIYILIPIVYIFPSPIDELIEFKDE